MHPGGAKDRAIAFTTLSLIKKRRRYLLSLILFLIRVANRDDAARQLASLYFARWLVISPERVARFAREVDARSAYLLFISDFTGDGAEYLTGFSYVLKQALNLVWGRCTAWHGVDNISVYHEYVRSHELDSDSHFSAYRNATVLDVRSALRVSDLLEQFALEGASPGAAATPEDRARLFRVAFDDLLLRLGPDLAS